MKHSGGSKTLQEREGNTWKLKNNTLTRTTRGDSLIVQ